jgi:hypothetical protein
MLRPAVILVLACAAAQAIQMTPPSRVTTPAETKTGPGLISRTMASLDAQSFGTALARAGHAAGFIMPNSETQPGRLPPDNGEMLTLDEAIGVFTASGRYKASKHGAVTVFQHVRAPAELLNSLDFPRQHYPIKATFSLALYDIVLRGLARRPIGTVSTREPGAGPECPVEQNITIPAGRSTPIQTMNALVSRVKGVAWLVRFGERGDPLRLQVGYVCGNGVWSALSVPGW